MGNVKISKSRDGSLSILFRNTDKQTVYGLEVVMQNEESGDLHHSDTFSLAAFA